jgi:acid stress-induced BolA-like protein IbaG/YrbA
MTPEQVKALVEAGIVGADVAVQGNGNKYGIRVVSEAFAGLMPVKRQQLVYGCLKDCLADGSIHAVDPLQTYTPDEWQRANRLGIA